MRRNLVIAILVVTMLLSACTPVNSLLNIIAPSEEGRITPGKMVTKIEIVSNPYDEAMSRSYAAQDSMSSVLRMLQNMATKEYPEEKVTFDSYSKYYTITAMYYSGEHTVYHLLDGMYLRSEGEDWCIIDAAKFREFEQFLMDNPTGDAAEKPTDPLVADLES